MSGGTPPVTVRSPIRMRPSLRGTRPAINPSSVVLPHPEGPTRLTNRPDPTRKLTSRTAVNSPVGVSNVRVTFWSAIIWPACAGMIASVLWRNLGYGSGNQGESRHRDRRESRYRARERADAARGRRPRHDLRANGRDGGGDPRRAPREDRR